MNLAQQMALRALHQRQIQEMFQRIVNKSVDDEEEELPPRVRKDTIRSKKDLENDIVRLSQYQEEIKKIVGKKEYIRQIEFKAIKAINQRIIQVPLAGKDELIKETHLIKALERAVRRERLYLHFLIQGTRETISIIRGIKDIEQRYHQGELVANYSKLEDVMLDILKKLYVIYRLVHLEYHDVRKCENIRKLRKRVGNMENRFKKESDQEAVFKEKMQFDLDAAKQATKEIKATVFERIKAYEEHQLVVAGGLAGALLGGVPVGYIAVMAAMAFTAAAITTGIIGIIVGSGIGAVLAAQGFVSKGDEDVADIPAYTYKLD